MIGASATPRHLVGLRFLRLVGLCTLLSAAATHGQLVVDQSGGGTHTSVQAAILDATEGAVITVMPGTYLEKIDFLGKGIHVTGSDPLTESVVDATIIDGGATGHAVTLQSGEGATTILEGVTITNGNAELGAGIYCVNGASPIIRNNHVTLNISFLHGTGIYVMGASPQILSNRITGNIGEGRGVGIFAESSSLVIEGNTITGNSTTKSSGGGINLGAGTDGARVTANTIEGNTAIFGGALHVEKASPLIERNWMVGNVGLQRAGGVSCIDSSAVFRSNVISGNWSIYGAGFDANHAEPLLWANTLVGNLADLDAVILGINESNLTLVGNIIAHSTQGVAVHVTDDSSAVLDYNCLFNNVAGDSAGPVILNSTNLYVDPLITALGAWVGGGGGFGPRANNEFRLIATMEGQENRTGEADYRLEPDRERFDVTVFGFPPNTSQPVYVRGIKVGSISINGLGTGIMELDTNDGNFPPGFPEVVEGDDVNVNSLAAGFLLNKDGIGMLWQSGDEHIQAASPCVDAWIGATPGDGEQEIDGESRLMGPYVDLGADEVQP